MIINIVLFLYIRYRRTVINKAQYYFFSEVCKSFLWRRKKKLQSTFFGGCDDFWLLISIHLHFCITEIINGKSTFFREEQKKKMTRYFYSTTTTKLLFIFHPTNKLPIIITRIVLFVRIQLTILRTLLYNTYISYNDDNVHFIEVRR